MGKAEKIYLWVCLALLVICLLLYRPIERYTFVELGGHASFYLGLLFAVLASIHFNIFWGVRGFAERFFGTLLVLVLTTGIIQGLFELARWVIEHVRIV